MATPGKNKIKFNRKYMATNPNAAGGPPTYIVDTSQTPPIDPCPPATNPWWLHRTEQLNKNTASSGFT